MSSRDSDSRSAAAPHWPACSLFSALLLVACGGTVSVEDAAVVDGRPDTSMPDAPDAMVMPDADASTAPPPPPCESCDAGQVCDNMMCRAPKSCRELQLHKAPAVLPDGTYTLEPDGAGSITAWCDMSTDGGGWTLVFLADVDDYQCTSTGAIVPIEYNQAAGLSSTLMGAAQEVLLVQRDYLTKTPIGSHARFLLPAEWQTASPMTDYNPPSQLVAAYINGASAVTVALWYGTGGFNYTTSNCGASPWGTSNNGRICLDHPDAPAFWDFCNNGTPQDRCGTTATPVPCGPGRRASIAVR